MEVKELIAQNPDSSPEKIAVEHLMKVKRWGLSSEKKFMETSILLQDFLDEANHIVEEINKVEYMECEVCNKKTEDVSSRPNSYAREIGGDNDAYHTVCDDCDYQNCMDI